MSFSYFSNYGENGYAAVRFFVLRKNVPLYKEKINNLVKRIKFEEDEVKEQEKKKDELSTRIKNDEEHLNLIKRFNFNPKKIRRIQELLFRLGYSKERFIAQFCSSP